MKKQIAFILGLFLVFPRSYALEEHTVAGDLTNFAQAFQYLFNGDMGGFVEGLVGSLPVIGLFVVVFGLMFFLTKITLFKDEKHTRYAQMIAAGVALIGLAQQKVYNAVLSWSTTFLIIAFIVMLIFMFILFFNHGRTQHNKKKKDFYDAKSDMYKSKSPYLQEKRKLADLKHEFSKDKKLYNGVDQGLGELKDELSDLRRLGGSQKNKVEKLISLARKAHEAAEDQHEGKIHNYVKSLTAGIQGLISTMDHEQQDIHQLTSILHHIREELKQWGHDDGRELKDVISSEHLLQKMAHKHHDDKALKNHELKALATDKKIQQELTQLQQRLKELVALERNFERREADMEHYGPQHKLAQANKVRDALAIPNFTQAQEHLGKLRFMIDEEGTMVEQMRVDYQAMHRMLHEIRSIESYLARLLSEEAKRLKKVGADS